MSRIATTPQTILAAIREKLIDDEIFTASTCLLAINDEQIILEPPPGNPYAAIVPAAIDVDLRQVAGGGRANTSVDWRVSVFVVTGVFLDQADRDNTLLTDTTLGAMQKIGEVMDSLHLYDPEDAANPSTGDLILNMPMRASTISKPRKDPAKYGVFEVVLDVNFKWSLS